MLFKRISFSNMSDDELIKYYKSTEDVDCIGELYKRYTGFTFSICLKYLKNHDNAREAVLEIFEELIEKILIHDIYNFKSWLHSVARNFCLLSFRSKKNDEDFSENYIKLHNNMEYEDILYPDYIVKEENYNKLEECISQLKENQKICIDLFYLQNKSYVEVSKITGYSMNEVKTHIQNGKRNLKILMENKK
ncbi:MAG: sigma-70 family RNA polymerase sigma factor [Bacteroidales bacterium]|jgi:RNA polymerase sigma-70 factor (ECF subfamily)|nr:sigma-70 family RNA polymerase sigma factor [Bacteroidales bacterium]